MVGTVILSASDRRNTYQEKLHWGQKSVWQPCNASWHLYQVLSVGDPTKTILAGPSVVGEKTGGNVGSICAAEIS